MASIHSRLACADPPPSRTRPIRLLFCTGQSSWEAQETGETLDSVCVEGGKKGGDSEELARVRVVLPELVCGHRCFRLKDRERS